tara:strand:- start:4850 stop:5569 length:720 start_codon:yes stop_codon:yes gene_type:complete
MNSNKSLNFLQDYVKKNINPNKPTTDLEDSGVRALILLVQENYHSPLGLKGVPNKKVTDIREAISFSYPIELYEYLADRTYISDILLNKPIRIEDYIENIGLLNEKIISYDSLPEDMQGSDGYELTHYVWGLYSIAKDNYILRTYKSFMINSLINLYKRIPEVNDLSTECLYFISLIEPNSIKEDWIIDLQNSQNKDGSFGRINKSWPKKNQEIIKAHHVGLALMVLHNFYNGVIETTV